MITMELASDGQRSNKRRVLIEQEGKKKKRSQMNKEEELQRGRRGGEQTVWKKQLDSIFHSIKYNHQLSALHARTHTHAHSPSPEWCFNWSRLLPCLDEIGKINQLENCVFSSLQPSPALSASLSVSLIWGGRQINFSEPTLCAWCLFVLWEAKVCVCVRVRACYLVLMSVLASLCILSPTCMWMCVFTRSRSLSGIAGIKL